MRSIRARSGAVRLSCIAATLSSMCRRLRAPTMVTSTAGWASDHAIASRLTETPSSDDEHADLVVGAVGLVQVDVLDAQRAQAVVHAAAKPRRTGIADEPVFGHAQAALGRDHHVIAALVEILAERRAEKSLGGAEAVALRGVEQVDSELPRTAYCRDPLRLVEPPPLAAELPRPEGVSVRYGRTGARATSEAVVVRSPSWPTTRAARPDEHALMAVQGTPSTT